MGTVEFSAVLGRCLLPDWDSQPTERPPAVEEAGEERRMRNCRVGLISDDPHISSLVQPASKAASYHKAWRFSSQEEQFTKKPR